jgi:effector-binding domain-containing protein
MLETPSVISAAEQTAAIIKITIPRPEMPTVMGPAIRELKEALRTQGIAPTGAVFAHHLRMDDAVFDFELGIPTDRPVATAGRVQSGSLPAGTVARGVYRGGYEGLSAAWSTMRRWIEQNGYDRTADLWEVYTAGPDLSQNPADWRTELNQPVRN